MRTVPAAAALLLSLGAAQAQQPPAGHELTRAEVREALHLARIGNRVTPDGERGDTRQVLQAREDFNALQAEVKADEAEAAAKE